MLGILGTSAWVSNWNTLSLSFAPDTPAATTTSTPPQSGAISVADQPAGSSVMLDSVTVPPPGVWVAVREVNGTDLGNVLGATRLTGPRSQISIPLLRATEQGFSYAAELYRDNGDNTFDLNADSVYIDFATGAPVVEHFSATP